MKTTDVIFCEFLERAAGARELVDVIIAEGIAKQELDGIDDEPAWPLSLASNTLRRRAYSRRLLFREPRTTEAE